ncbi:MAG: hypothetical protein ABIN58_00810 [candidate division WOR-3 bacterium]
MGVRVTQTNLEVTSTDQTPKTRVTQSAFEIASSQQTPVARVTQSVFEIASGNTNPGARVTQDVLEILVWKTSSAIYSSTPVGTGPVLYPGTVSLGAPPSPPVNIYTPSGGGKALVFRPEGNEYDKAVLEAGRRVSGYLSQLHPQQLSPMGMSGLGASIPRESRYRLRKSFLKQGAIVTPAPAAGEVTIVEFEVPEGYRGVISGYYWTYTGTGFAEDSGDIIWRLRVGLSYPKGMGNIRTQIGSPATPFTPHSLIPLRSRQRVRLSVIVPNNSGLIQVGTSNILGGLSGWFYEDCSPVLGL